ncbi:MAG: hypothetical protein ACRCTJ_02710 [Brevinema sp.]
MKAVFYNNFNVVWYFHTGRQKKETLIYPISVTLGAVIKHCKQRAGIKGFYVEPIKQDKKEFLSV